MLVRRLRDPGLALHPVPARAARRRQGTLTAASQTLDASAPESAGDDAGGSVDTPDFEIPEIWAGSAAGREQYREQLMRFAALHGGDMVRLRELRAAGDADAEHALVHRLKGAAGTLGIRRVAALVTELDRAMRSEAGDAIVGYLTELCHAELEGMAFAEESSARLRGALPSA